jgi:hypothetical protein
MLTLPPAGNVVFVPGKSAWNSSSQMVTILQRLAKLLREKAPCRYPILLLDYAKLHLTADVLKEAKASGIRVVPIPASTTAWLQPLDAGIFQGCKAAVWRAFDEQRLSTADGHINVTAFLEILTRVASKYLCSSFWKLTFESHPRFLA